MFIDIKERIGHGYVNKIGGSVAERGREKDWFVSLHSIVGGD